MVINNIQKPCIHLFLINRLANFRYITQQLYTLKTFLLVARYLLGFARCSLAFAHYLLAFARCLFAFAHCSLVFACYWLLFAHFSLLFLRYLSGFAHFSLIFALSSLLITVCLLLLVARYLFAHRML